MGYLLMKTMMIIIKRTTAKMITIRMNEDDEDWEADNNDNDDDDHFEFQPDVKLDALSPFEIAGAA